jgi:hypothetical protein
MDRLDAFTISELIALGEQFGRGGQDFHVPLASLRHLR